MASERRCERVGIGVWPTRLDRSHRSPRRVRGHRALVSHVSARQTGGYQTARSRLLTVPWSARTSVVAERQEVSAWIARKRQIAPNRRHAGVRCSIALAWPIAPAPMSLATVRPTIPGDPRTRLRITRVDLAQVRTVERRAGPGDRPPKAAAVGAIASSIRLGQPIRMARTVSRGQRRDPGSEVPMLAPTGRRSAAVGSSNQSVQAASVSRPVTAATASRPVAAVYLSRLVAAVTASRSAAADSLSRLVAAVTASR
jgi:hypothetical protein